MDYYQTLGVSKNASQEDLKKAYRKLAMENHPDRTGGDDTRFKKINEAYDILKDPSKRQQYDNPQPRFDSNTFQDNFGNFNDIFSQMFGARMHTNQRPQKNKDIVLNVNVDLKDIVKGKTINGKYMLHSGREEVAQIVIPAGIQTGQTITFSGLGDNSITSIPRGNLHVKITVLADKNFKRDGNHLRTSVTINLLEFIFGTEVNLNVLNGSSVKIKIPAGTNPGVILSIPNYGLPELNTNRVGNLYVEVKGVTPKIQEPRVLEQVKYVNEQIKLQQK